MSFEELLEQKIKELVDKRINEIIDHVSIPSIDKDGEIHGMENINRYLKEKHGINYATKTLYKKKSLGEIPLHSINNRPVAKIIEVDEWAKAGCPNWKMYKASQVNNNK